MSSPSGTENKPFPFMRLPPELRRMVYQYVFYRKHVVFHCQKYMKRYIAGYSTFMGMKPLMVSKQIYRESTATYLSETKFYFSEIPVLRRFLLAVGREGRELLTSIEFKYTRSGAVSTFRLLRECTSLRSLGITVRVESAPYVNNKHRLMRRSGIKQLLAIRGIQHLDLDDIRLKPVVRFVSPLGQGFDEEMRPHFEEDKAAFIAALQVLKLPRYQAPPYGAVILADQSAMALADQSAMAVRGLFKLCS